MLTDLDESGLATYRSNVIDPTDFDEFWATTINDASTYELAVTLTPVHTELATIDVFDVAFSGFGGHRIRGWLYLPKKREQPLPAVVQYQGYGGGRGHAYESLLWSAAGYAHLKMDNRGQGSSYHRGATGDPVGPSGPAFPGLMTNGIDSPHDHYYRRLFTDAVRAVDVMRQIPNVDAGRIAVVGGSQGGALALAAAALRRDVSAVVAYVPFLCDIKRASRITDAMPSKELGRYLSTHRDRAEQVFRTLSYFDGVSMARRITAPAVMSAGLMDPTCPPSTVFGAYHELAGPKQMSLWEYNAHEGGGPEDDERAINALGEILR